MNRRSKALVTLGGVGSVGCLGAFANEPSFLTPDKLLVIALFVGLFFGQAKQVLLRLGPFVVLLLTYESFRGIAHQLNQRVNFTFMIDADKFMFGTLPTKTLQDWWWDGTVKWYDFAFYAPYMLHFVLPFVLAIVVWKTREHEYWRYITAYISISFFAFLIFLIFPAAPPWMASDIGLIEPIGRISSNVWFAIGLADFPSFYNEVAPNPVAAVPSLHAAYATLFAMFVINFYKSRARWAILIYPALIYIGTVYQGEHYVIDAIFGAALGIAGFYASPYILKVLKAGFNKIHKSVRPIPALVLSKLKQFSS